MAAWRGRRWLTWMTGVVAFLASIVECFTGYLSQQNFDSQWIATNGKDAFNAAGVGAFFNLMNFGQMLLWHVVLIPVVLIALVGTHLLLVRVRGVSHPLPARYPALRLPTPAALREALSSPDVPPVTVKTWVQVDPAGFLGTAATELNGTSGSATLGPPYNNNGAAQQVLIAPGNWAGVRQPIDTAQTFVLQPLTVAAANDPAVKAALAAYNAAPAALQDKWTANCAKAVTKVKFANGIPVVPPAADGPVPVLLATERSLARSGAIDTDLLAQRQLGTRAHAIADDEGSGSAWGGGGGGPPPGRGKNGVGVGDSF